MRCHRCGRIGHYQYDCRSFVSEGSSVRRPLGNFRFNSGRRRFSARHGNSLPWYRMLAISAEEESSSFETDENLLNAPAVPDKNETDELRDEVAALRDQFEHLALQPFSAPVASVVSVQFQPAKASQFRNYRLLSGWFLCLLVFVIGTTVSQLEPVRMFSLCGASQSGHFVSVPRRVLCIPPQPEHVTETPMVVYVPHSMPGQIPAFKCSFQKYEDWHFWVLWWSGYSF